MPPSIRQAAFARAIVRADQAPPQRPAVAFAGRSNVGKSSLINRLTGRKGLARTSSTPGRTQEIVYFDIEGPSGELWHFIDLPGYGYARVPEAVRRRWGPMIERFLRTAKALRLVVVILDVRRDPTPEDLQMVEWLCARGLPFIFAVTKTDKLSRGQVARRLEALREPLGLEDTSALVPVSSQTGDGVADLLHVIRETLNAPSEDNTDDHIPTAPVE